jgi:NADP-dependent aldehyde dehydrogenase
LVRHPLIKAVGFTGSRRGGRALMDIAAARPEPIPVYTEMSSINPLVILPGALAQNAASLAAGLQGSVTLGVGQFCTNPGLVFVPAGAAGDAFLDDFAARMTETAPGTMLTAGICTAYGEGVGKLSASGASLKSRAAAGENLAGAAVFETDATQLINEPALTEEVFGPATLVVRYANGDELRAALRALDGQLTATLHASTEELAASADLVSILEEKAGRVLVGGFPTGVEVAHAMVHGGPYPATSDGRSTSVGTRAIERFTRAVCWQNFPDAALPQELQEPNPLGIKRLVDGAY